MMGVGAKRALGLYRSCAPRQLCTKASNVRLVPRVSVRLQQGTEAPYPME